MASTKDCKHAIYNITRCELLPITLAQAATTVIDIVGSGKWLEYDKDPNFPSRGRLSIARARTDLGYEPKVDFEQGCKQYIEWMKANDTIYKS